MNSTGSQLFFGLLTIAGFFLAVAGGVALLMWAPILKRVGAHHVVLPEHEMGERVAHLVAGRILNFIEFEDDYAVAQTLTPAEVFDRTLADVELRTRYGVTVVSIKRPGQPFTYVTPATTLYAGDPLIVAGTTPNVETFANLP